MSLCQSSATTASGASRRRWPASSGVGTRGRQFVDVVKQRLKHPRCRNDALGDAFGEARDGRLLAMDEKKPALNRAASGDPSRQLRSVGMPGIVVDGADCRRDLDLVTLNTDGLGAVDEEPAQRALRLEADQQYGGPAVPKPVSEMVPDTPGIAHAAGGDDDVKAGQLGDPLALVDRLGEPQLRGVQQPAHVDRGIEAFGVLAKHLGRTDRQRRIEEDRGGRDLAALHQVDQIDDEFLGALHRKGRNQQGALAARGVAHLGGEACATGIRRRRRTVAVAIGRFRNDVVEAGGRLRVGLEQFGVRADIAGGENAQGLVRVHRVSAHSISIEAEPSRCPAFQ